MATYVLVGGAWIGGWAWQDVARRLRGRGHDVYPVTLTGLGERVHLARPEIDLETHLADVVNLMVYENLNDVVLVGHSYAGIVVTGVADRLPDRIGQLVYLDSAPFEDGEAALDMNSPEGKEQLRRLVEEDGDGWRLPFPSFEDLAQSSDLEGLGEAERVLMEARATAHPFGTWTQPLRLAHPGAGDYSRVIIACNDLRALLATGMPRFQVLAPPAWRVIDLATGHWPMLSAPDALATTLHDLAAGR
jgi:pimeloyl-ACP methyl ester carboxylesterase